MSLVPKYPQQKTIDLDDFVSHLFSRQTASVYYLNGPKESGKSNLALNMMDMVDYSGTIKIHATNIEIFDSPFDIEPISDLQTLIRWCELYKSKRQLFIFDETAKSLPRRRAMNKLNVDVLGELQTLRHFKLSLIMIASDFSYVEGGTLNPNILDGYFKRFNKANQDKAIFYDLYNLKRPPTFISRITSTRIKYNPYGVSKFTSEPKLIKPLFKDVDLSLLYDWAVLGKTPDELGISRKKINRLTKKYISNTIKIKQDIKHI